jgi:hypothetical protein
MNDSEQLAQTIVEKIIALLEQRAGRATAEREQERLRERDTDVGRLPQTARAYIDARPTQERRASALATATMVHRNRVLDGAGVTPEARRRAGPQREGESDADYVARARKIQEEVRMRNLKGGVRAYAGAQRGDESDEDYLARGRAARGQRKQWGYMVAPGDKPGEYRARYYGSAGTRGVPGLGETTGTSGELRGGDPRALASAAQTAALGPVEELKRRLAELLA